MKKYTLKFRATDKKIFQALLDGTKKVETRAKTIKYEDIKKGDEVVLSCGTKKLVKIVTKVKSYKSISAILKDYKPQDITPWVKSKKKLEAIYYSFPSYKEKIAEFGLIAIEFEK